MACSFQKYKCFHGSLESISSKEIDLSFNVCLHSSCVPVTSSVSILTPDFTLSELLCQCCLQCQSHIRAGTSQIRSLRCHTASIAFARPLPPSPPLIQGGQMNSRNL
ncbi:unnamed protein product [Rangifer tarandus platyrhynchus]|uniref:Uncharacterized protein n=2 Tax=Rangifer tarandus platyrhynchus TaxID=3082113 RepID=A0ABN8ZSY1_RANTA|nr:unnamed protein product [Rangifer tarandus platyrhynchus]